MCTALVPAAPGTSVNNNVSIDYTSSYIALHAMENHKSTELRLNSTRNNFTQGKKQ
jgi:hypothetical protein